MSVLLETSLGSIVVDLYCDERPRSSLNFLKLCKLKYYNYCLFHSVQKNLVAQAGDPTGTGRGGESVFASLYGEQAKYFDAERKPKIKHHSKGLISMVNYRNGQHGSQFFITLADKLDYLDNEHTVFGQLAEGFEFLERMNEVYCDKEFRPYRNVRIHHTIVLADPFPDPTELELASSSPEYVPNIQLVVDGPPRLEEDEVLDETVGLSPKQLEELRAEHEATTNAQLLTLIGDLPEVDVKPPDNVLFVCRLNPVTTAEDLEIIFSRFGDIASCEVIKDKRTGASLQYAFIEFVREEDCENAFFKMDKVIIDDRRIHVDFSQSVAKEWQQYKRQKSQPVQQSGDRGYQPPRSSRKPTHKVSLDLLKQKVIDSRHHGPSRYDRSRHGEHHHHRSSRSPARHHRGPHSHSDRIRPNLVEKKYTTESVDSDLDLILSDAAVESSSGSSSSERHRSKKKKYHETHSRGKRSHEKKHKHKKDKTRKHRAH